MNLRSLFPALLLLVFLATMLVACGKGGGY
jgi:hypothetical protein